MKQLMNRLQQPTPPFFQKIRNIGLVIAAVGTSILASPVALPVLLVNIAGYLGIRRSDGCCWAGRDEKGGKLTDD